MWLDGTRLDHLFSWMQKMVKVQRIRVNEELSHNDSYSAPISFLLLPQAHLRLRGHRGKVMGIM